MAESVSAVGYRYTAPRRQLAADGLVSMATCALRCVVATVLGRHTGVGRPIYLLRRRAAYATLAAALMRVDKIGSFGLPALVGSRHQVRMIDDRPGRARLDSPTSQKNGIGNATFADIM